MTEMELLEQTKGRARGRDSQMSCPRWGMGWRKFLGLTLILRPLTGFCSSLELDTSSLAVSDLVASQAEMRGGEFGEEEERYGAAVREAA